MNKSLILLSLISTLILVGGCSGPQGKTPTSIQFTSSFSAVGSTPGGTMFHAIKRGSMARMARVITGNSTTFSFDNGEWDFFVTQWSGPNHLQGDMSCDFKYVVLDGTPQSISFSTNSSKCTSPQYTPGDYLNGSSALMPIALANCSELPTTTSAAACDGNYRGSAVSYRVSLGAFNLTASDDFDIYGDLYTCVNAATGTIGMTPTSIYLPLGALNFSPFATFIEAYSGSNCTGNYLYHLSFIEGITNAFHTSNSQSLVDTLTMNGIDYVTLFLRPSTSLPPFFSDITMWLDSMDDISKYTTSGASTLTTTTGDPVCAWLDSKSIHDALQATTIDCPTMAGDGSLYFDGTQELRVTSSPDIAGTGGTSLTAYTIIVVAKHATGSIGGANQQLLKKDDGTNKTLQMFFEASIGDLDFSHGGSTVYTTTGQPGTVAHVYGFTHTNAIIHVYRNGVDIGNTATGAIAMNAAELIIGDQTIGFNGYIYEIIFYNRALSASEHLTVDNHLATKWGLPP